MWLVNQMYFFFPGPIPHEWPWPTGQPGLRIWQVT